MITALMVQELEDVPVTESDVPGERAFREAQLKEQGLALKQNNNTPPGYGGEGGEVLLDVRPFHAFNPFLHLP